MRERFQIIRNRTICGYDDDLEELFSYKIECKFYEDDFFYGLSIHSIICNNIQSLKYHVEQNNEDINIQDGDGQTPLYKASLSDNLDIVKYLIEECKVDPNIQNKYK